MKAIILAAFVLVYADNSYAKFSAAEIKEMREHRAKLIQNYQSYEELVAERQRMYEELREKQRRAYSEYVNVVRYPVYETYEESLRLHREYQESLEVVPVEDQITDERIPRSPAEAQVAR